MGYYLPTADQPGLELPLLIDGISYPGVQVSGPNFNQNTGFDVGNFDINPFDNISYGPEGLPTYDPAILDAIYENEYLDLYLGTRPTDINVDGGAYVDTFSSHAPQELVPGAEFDTLDMRVYTTPGADWAVDGHGFPSQVKNYVYDPLTPTFAFADAVTLPYPTAVLVVNQTTNNSLDLGVDYTVDWPGLTVTVILGANTGDVIQVQSYELGGGNQLYKNIYNGANIGNSVVIPVTYSLIEEIAVFVNGVVTTAFTYSQVDSITTVVNFTTTYTATDSITLVAIGPTTIDSTTVNYSWSTPQTQIIAGQTGVLSYTLTNSLEYTNPDNVYVTVNGVRARTSAGIEWYGDGSTEYLVPTRLGVDQSLIADNEVHVYLNSVSQVLNVDFIVEPYNPFNGHDGRRQVLFIVEPSIGEQILITVNTDTQCLVNGNQLVFDATAGLVPNNGDTIAVTTWNDTRQQNILTQVFVGPITTGVTVTENYDETDYDVGTISGSPGSYDYAAGITVTVNSLILEHTITDPSRLWVTLNGNRLLSGSGFNLINNEIILTSGQILGVTDVVMVTEFTDSVVPEAMAFRIFQDMRGVQATYRITPGTTTVLAQALSANSDTIYVVDASALDNPNLAANIWGVLTVNGERIMYRERNTTNNTVSSLLRGTAGTAVADHTAGASVYNMGRGNLLPAQFQNYIVSDSISADGTTTLFVATDIDITTLDSTTIEEAVEVYVGGLLVTHRVIGLVPGVSYTISSVGNTDWNAVGLPANTTPTVGTAFMASDAMVNAGNFVVGKEYVIIDTGTSNPTNFTLIGASNNNPNTAFIATGIGSGTGTASAQGTGLLNYTITGDTPVTIVFTTAPVSGVQVTVLVRRGVTWYAPGIATPSNGVALQETNTQAARFLRGL